MGRKLVPAMEGFDQGLELGAILFLPDYLRTGSEPVRALQFQYNPETVTRTREGEWSRDRAKSAKGFQPQQDRFLKEGQRGGGLFAKSETISFKLLFDADDVALRGDDDPNVLPELGFLEQIALGGDEPMKTSKKVAKPLTEKQKSDAAKKKVTGSQGKTGSTKGATDKTNSGPKKQYTTKVQPTAPSEIILILGPRSFPVVLTSLTITEQRFNHRLEPVRAECDCKFRVLEASELKHNPPATIAFKQLIEQRSAAALKATIGGSDSDRIASVVSALSGRR